MHFVDITMFYAAEGGGVSTYLNAKARWLSRFSCARHTIASPNVATRSKAPALLHLPGVAVPGINGYRLPLSAGGLARILRRLQPDLVEAGDAGPCAWAALRLKRQLGIPAVAFYHSDLQHVLACRFGPTAGQLARAYLARLYRQFDLVLAPSRLMVRQLAQMGVVGALQQPLGIDTHAFAQPRRGKLLRQRLSLAPGTRLLVYAGRFTLDKKLDVLIDAVHMLGKPYHLLLVGAGVANLPRLPHTTYLPYRRDPYMLGQLLASCDVLVHPGDCETFGLIVLEAMASGLPVVATTGGAIGELVDEHTGLLVAPNSVAALADGIDAIFQRDLRAMGQAGVCKAREHYDWQIVMPRLMGRYAGVLATGPRAELEAGTICVSD